MAEIVNKRDNKKIDWDWFLNEVSKMSPEKYKKIIDDAFRLADIKKWLRQKQIYFGWNHNYNIKVDNKKGKGLKFLECPNCGDTRLRVIIFNEFKKPHHYLVWCCNCDWSQEFKHRWGFSGSSRIFKQHLLNGHKPHLNREELHKRGYLND